tara:strand:+ start:304 stop:498 length:195 start_codon:yes stop_codon:yes gene_type:complete
MPNRKAKENKIARKNANISIKKSKRLTKSLLKGKDSKHKVIKGKLYKEDESQSNEKNFKVFVKV